MRKARIFLISGVWVAVLPYLGFPIFWKNLLFVLSGLGIVYFSYLLFKEYKAKEEEEKTFDNFAENSDFQEIKTEASENDLN